MRLVDYSRVEICFLGTWHKFDCHTRDFLARKVARKSLSMTIRDGSKELYLSKFSGGNHITVLQKNLDEVYTFDLKDVVESIPGETYQDLIVRTTDCLMASLSAKIIYLKDQMDFLKSINSVRHL